MSHYIFPFTTQYNPSLMMFEYSFWDLGERIQFLSNEELCRGDLCKISSINSDRVYVEKVNLDIDSDMGDIRSIVCISNAIPFSEDAEFKFVTDQDILIKKKVTKASNSSYLLLLSVTPNIDHTIIVKSTSNDSSEYDTEVEIKVLSVANLIEE